MMILLLTLSIFLLVFTAMMLGVLFGRQPIKGSCGGIGAKCASCERPCSKSNKGK